jgi:phosphate transport system substrate-binding protein
MSSKSIVGSWRVSAFVLASLLLAGCGGETPAAAATGPALAPFLGLEGKLAIAGGTAHIPVMEQAQKHIMTANPKIAITVAGGGTGQGVKQVTAGLVQIGNTGRALSADEIKAGGLLSFPFAIDGVAVVVHPDNPAAALTAQQVRDVFAGKLTNWKEVGGNDLAIHCFTREEGSGTRSTFWEELLQKGEITAAANVVDSNGSMKTAVTKDPGAIGYLSIGHVDAGLKLVAIDGVEPTQANAASGVYKVTRKLYMNTKGEPGGLTKAFVDYIFSAEGAGIIRANGYLPIAR